MIYVDFPDCTFGVFEPHRDIDFHGKKYKAIDVVFDDGTGEKKYTIAAFGLYSAMDGLLGDPDTPGDLLDEIRNLDNTIAYYAEDDESLYNVIGDNGIDVVGQRQVVLNEMTGGPKKFVFDVPVTIYAEDLGDALDSLQEFIQDHAEEHLKEVR